MVVVLCVTDEAVTGAFDVFVMSRCKAVTFTCKTVVVVAEVRQAVGIAVVFMTVVTVIVTTNVFVMSRKKAVSFTSNVSC